jgi:hypothetical protein
MDLGSGSFGQSTTAKTIANTIAPIVKCGTNDFLGSSFMTIPFKQTQANTVTPQHI